MQKRSIGLTILGWFEIVVGFLGTFFFLFYLLFFIAYAQSYNSLSNDFPAIIIAFLPPAMLMLSLFFTGTGILKLKKWAWIVSIILYPFIHIYVYIIRFWLHEQFWNIFFVSVIDKIFFIWWLIPICLIFYLTRPKVKAQFFKDSRRD